MPRYKTSAGTKHAPGAAANSHKNPRMSVKGSDSSSATAASLETAGGSDTADAADDVEGADGLGEKPIDHAPSSALENIKIEDDTAAGTIPAAEQTAGPPSEAEGDDDSSTADFELADDDDDYTGLDLISISSGDLHVQKQESTFIEQALRGESEWVNELQDTNTALPANIDWNDEGTYRETPSSGLYDEFNGFPDVDAASPLSHVHQTQALQSSAQLLMYKDADPALRRPLFARTEEDAVDLFDGSTSTTSSSSASSPRSVAQAADDSYSHSADSLTVASRDDSDTESEDLTAEIEERIRRTEQRKKTERRRKQKVTPKTIKLRPKAADNERRPDVFKQFRLKPGKALAVHFVTPRGSVLKVFEPSEQTFKIKWVTGRTRPNPVEDTPMSAAYAIAMQSTMFRALHCPNSPSLSFQRNKRAMASQFGANLMLNSPGLLPMPALEGLHVEYGEATDQDITDLFLDLDNESDAGDDSDYGSTPGAAVGRIREVDQGDDEDDDESRSEASHYQTPTPLPRLDAISKNSSGEMSEPSSAMDEDTSDLSQTPATPTGRPRKRTIDNADVDEIMQSPSKRHRIQSTRNGISV